MADEKEPYLELEYKYGHGEPLVVKRSDFGTKPMVTIGTPSHKLILSRGEVAHLLIALDDFINDTRRGERA